MKTMMRCVVLALAAAVAVPAVASAQMVILVRHAERADGGAGAQTGAAMTAAPDPELSEAGKARAAALAGMLKDAGITAIYTTEYRRTRDTAAPLAGLLKMSSEAISSRDQAALVAKIKTHTSGVVLVVGHSNSVPAIIKALGGPDVTIGDNEYDNLFFVGPGGVTTRVRFRP